MVYFGTFGHYFNINSCNEPYLQLGLIALLFGSFCHHHWWISNLCFAAPLHAQIST